MKYILLTLGFLILLPSSLYAKETTFPSKDGLAITADIYLTNKDKPIIVLFHQAGWSRGEYLEIAPKLNKLGFNAIAVDLRSGKKVNGVINQTAKNARKGMRYVDAVPDIEAALKYARGLVDKNTKVIAWGSSYSAALVLKITGDHPELADAVLSFSPGEYFMKYDKPADWVQQSAKKILHPVFITSARSEEGRWKPIFEAIKSKNKIGFVPKTKGHHGSRALWEKYQDSDAYWDAVKGFLLSL